MFIKTEVLEENSAIHATPEENAKKNVLEMVKKDRAQFEFTDTGVPLNPQHFFSAKDVYKSHIDKGIFTTDFVEKGIVPR